MSLKELEKTINYTFKNIELLERALTHKSKNNQNYERMEFLGDSVLGFIISEALYEKFPNISEGKLSRIRSQLVRGETLTQLAIELKIPQYIILGLSELKSGGVNRPSILEDVLEAIFGAIYLDSDFITIKEVILKLYQIKLENVSPNIEIRDPKSQLQEYLQSKKLELPIYEHIATTGKDHNAIFTVQCYLKEMKMTVQQKNTTIKKAEQACAAILLKRINDES
ncbi:Ribonuclease III [hydrothermal vent metagenome]|uniref:ribonuclease III n=1 Tax=hydrothermal vent metagenome TaxID=652676 RepID=A0A1W1CQ68_9ZZZZ